MRQVKPFFFIVFIAIVWSCQNSNKIKVSPLENLKQVDSLLSEIAEKPQLFTAPSDKQTKVTGQQGTVIHVDPNKLETIDGTPPGESISIELIEMTDNKSLTLNNAQTVSGGRLLVTGGAYYLNMTSDGKQLKMKQGKGMEVEFPKLTEDEMSLFFGSRDSIGQINWIQANQSFKSKNLQKPQKPESGKAKKKESNDEIKSLLSYIKAKQDRPLTPEEIEERKRGEKEYERLKRNYEIASKTYESVELLNFGWINCDRFLNDQGPMTDIRLLVNDDSLSGAKIYAVFSDINSVMIANYWKGMQDTASLRNIPIGRELTIFAITVKNETPYLFEKAIKTEAEQQIQIEFEVTTQKEIEEKIQKIK